MIRIGLARVLQSADVNTVGETGDALEALALVRRERPDLLVLGQHSGSTAALVRQAKEAADPPAVAVLLGRVEQDGLAELLAAGADGLLVQSVGPDELVAALGRLLTGERVVSPALLPSLVGMVGVADDGGATPVAALTAKERNVLAALAEGRSNSEIATSLYLSPATVKTHLNHIYAKLGVRSRHEAVARAVALGLLR